MFKRKQSLIQCYDETQLSKSELLNNIVNPLGDQVAPNAEGKKPSSDPEEPLEVALVFLSGNPDVHAPETGYDVHGEDDRAEHGELAEDVGGLFLSLVHADVNLCKVVSMRTGQDPTGKGLARLFRRWM